MRPVVAAASAKPGQFRRADAACKAPACTHSGELDARIDYTAGMQRLLFIIVWIGASLPLAADADDIRLPAGLAKGDSATAVEIVDGDTLVLDSGVEVRLVGLQAPKLPLGRKNFKAWPLAEDAKAALAELTQGRRLRMHFGGRRMDRHGRHLAHLEDMETGRWIQGALLARGMARVYTFRDNRAVIPEMLRLERAARATRRGIWGHPYYRIRPAGAAGRDIGSFQLVAGAVRKVAVVRGTTYLNFGADWRSDFTVMVRGRDRKRWRKAGLSLTELEGKQIRVRGWLKSRNGPMIEATHPEQIEMVGTGR